MKRIRMSLAAATAALLGLVAAPVDAATEVAPATVPRHTVVGLTAENTLVQFDSTRPQSLRNERAVTGLEPGERLLGIDVRPANNRLYALGSANRIYTLDRSTGRATPVGARLSPGVIGDDVGFDFNPVADRIRINSNASQSLRVHPDTGAVVVDGTLAYVPGDRRFGSGARVVASAYTNSVAGATTTALFNLDADHNSLALQAPPNEGKLSTVGSLGFDVVDLAGFDISPAGTALAAVGSGGPSQLRSLNLANGTSQFVGSIGNYRYLRDIAIVS